MQGIWEEVQKGQCHLLGMETPLGPVLPISKLSPFPPSPGLTVCGAALRLQDGPPALSAYRWVLDLLLPSGAWTRVRCGPLPWAWNSSLVIVQAGLMGTLS